jgi:alpha-mannosidase
VLVFNPLSWERSEVVEAEVQFPSKAPHVRVLSPDGKPTPSEVVARDGSTNTLRIRFMASGVPSVGYKVFRLEPGAPVKVTNALKASSTALENEYVRVTIDDKTGCITELTDKTHNIQVLAPAVSGDGAPAQTPDSKPCGNLLQAFVDKPKKWDAWNIDADFIKQHTDLMQADEVKLVESTPLKAVVRVKKHFQNSKFEQDITLFAGSPRLDVNMRADWHEKHVLLKVAFPLSAQNERATFEIPYGSIERPTTRRTPKEQAKFEVPALRWADLSDAQHGFSLLNDSKYGYDAKDNVLRLSLLRAPEWPDPHADEGTHEFTYSLYPHAGGWQKAMTVRRGYELNYPMWTTTVQPHAGTLPSTLSYFSADANNVVLTAIKQDEDDNDLTLRMYEWAGKPAVVHLKTPAGMAVSSSTNLMEVPDQETSKEIQIGAYEIKTLRLKRTQPER